MQTKFEPNNIRNSAKAIGAIMDDMTAFTGLKANWPDAGNFELAQWLERVVDDRRNAIVAHAEHLRTTFEDMQTTLTGIADDFENADGDNAGKIKSSITDLQSKAAGDVKTFDKGTEKEQGNFTGDNKPDGDGYNDNNTPA